MRKTSNFPCLAVVLLLTLLLAHSCFPAAMAATNISTDESALLALKSHITMDPDSILERNWSISSISTATSVCEWIGVTCGNNSHHGIRVTGLNMLNMDLTGTIPSEFGNLSFLVYLNLGYNNFHGVLPEGMARLRRFEVHFFEQQLIFWKNTCLVWFISQTSASESHCKFLYWFHAKFNLQFV